MGMEQRTKVGEFPFARDKERRTSKNKERTKKKKKKNRRRKRRPVLLALVHDEIFAD